MALTFTSSHGLNEGICCSFSASAQRLSHEEAEPARWFPESTAAVIPGTTRLRPNEDGARRQGKLSVAFTALRGA